MEGGDCNSLQLFGRLCEKFVPDQGGSDKWFEDFRSATVRQHSPCLSQVGPTTASECGEKSPWPAVGRKAQEGSSVLEVERSLWTAFSAGRHPAMRARNSTASSMGCSAQTDGHISAAAECARREGERTARRRQRAVVLREVQLNICFAVLPPLPGTCYGTSQPVQGTIKGNANINTNR